jgi:hypothetical protein
MIWAFAGSHSAWLAPGQGFIENLERLTFAVSLRRVLHVCRLAQRLARSSPQVRLGHFKGAAQGVDPAKPLVGAFYRLPPLLPGDPSSRPSFNFCSTRIHSHVIRFSCVSNEVERSKCRRFLPKRGWESEGRNAGKRLRP